MDDIVDKIDGFISNNRILIDEISLDEKFFDDVMELVLSLEPEQLNEEQTEKMVYILENMNFEEEDELEELRKATKSTSQEKQYYKQYARKNRMKIKLKRDKFKKSAEGKRRSVLKNKMAKSGKTPTGRKKVQYHK
jgi:hypothetical protein